ncbi:MAG: nucleoside/nucleotide kinase family protein [Gammaproteobacteria bacterium]|nr:nucleoside/nucleotide kinase family protein [Gammaproteobacteria bacterium]
MADTTAAANPTRLAFQDFANVIADQAGTQRILVAIVGAPGSGKSTTSEWLAESLRDTHQLDTQVVPMDGFHYDNAILDARDLRPRKGAPETFDVDGLENLLARLAKGDKDVAVPVFEREVDLARASARLIPQHTQVLLIEGNYLLLQADPWSALRQYFDLSAMIDADEVTLRQRLMQRWLDLDYSEESARTKVEGNDMLNAKRVLHESATPDYILTF